MCYHVVSLLNFVHISRAGFFFICSKQAVIYIRRIQSTSNFTMTLVCDVVTFEEGVSLAHALVFHDRARMPNPKLHVN